MNSIIDVEKKAPRYKVKDLIMLNSKTLKMHYPIKSLITRC
jgi:hypothetical protein